jgi:nicotinamidase-related amidase
MIYLCYLIYHTFFSDDPQTKTNTILIDKLCQADKLIICGQALSHCVRYTLEDILKHWKKDKKLVYLLKNCSSSVSTEESKISANNFLREMESEITVCNDSEVFDI